MLISEYISYAVQLNCRNFPGELKKNHSHQESFSIVDNRLLPMAINKMLAARPNLIILNYATLLFLKFILAKWLHHFNFHTNRQSSPSKQHTSPSLCRCRFKNYFVLELTTFIFHQPRKPQTDYYTAISPSLGKPDWGMRVISPLAQPLSHCASIWRNLWSCRTRNALARENRCAPGPHVCKHSRLVARSLFSHFRRDFQRDLALVPGN